MKRLLLVIASVVTVVAACGSTPETPQEGLEAIAKLYEQRDFDALVRTRYAEIDKAESEEQIQQLVERFSSRFSGEAQLTEAVAAYREAAKLEPTLSEDGTVAEFTLEQGVMKISTMKNGKWGFHL